MNPQIEVRTNGGMISTGETLFFNFDNGLRLKAFLHNGIVSAAWVSLNQGRSPHSAIELIECRERMGSDAFADFIHEISNMKKKEIQALREPWFKNQRRRVAGVKIKVA